jgi:hypothetical protein
MGLQKGSKVGRAHLFAPDIRQVSGNGEAVTRPTRLAHPGEGGERIPFANTD